MTTLYAVISGKRFEIKHYSKKFFANEAKKRFEKDFPRSISYVYDGYETRQVHGVYCDFYNEYTTRFGSNYRLTS